MTKSVVFSFAFTTVICAAFRPLKSKLLKRVHFKVGFDNDVTLQSTSTATYFWPDDVPEAWISGPRPQNMMKGDQISKGSSNGSNAPRKPLHPSSLVDDESDEERLERMRRCVLAQIAIN